MRAPSFLRERAQGELDPTPWLQRAGGRAHANGPARDAEAAPWPARCARREPRGPVRMFLVVDQAMVREGVHRLLERRGRYRVVGAAADPLDALPAILDSLAELVVCAFYREGSLALQRLSPLKAALPACRLLLLDEHGDPDSRAALHRSGVDAVLPARAHPDELLLALDSIRRGYPYLSPALAGRSGPAGGPERESGRP